MADFAATLDPDRARRDRWFAAIRPSMGSLPSRTVGEFHFDDVSMLWSVRGRSPLSWIDNPFFAALLMGEARRDGSSKPVEAGEIAESWLGPKEILEDWDGFHLAIAYDKIRRCLLVGSDCLGVFPVYYGESPGGIVVASSPDLLAEHAGADLALDVEGLAGILHTCGLVGGRTLMRGIRRLPPARVLEGDASGKRLRSQTGVPWLETPASWEGTDPMLQSKVMAEAAAAAAADLFPSASTISTGLLLSGGLDSRTMVGYLREQGISPNVATFGSPWDIEGAVARQVASHMGWSQTFIPEYPDLYPDVARWSVQREGLSTGLKLLFGSVISKPDCLLGVGDRIVTGLQLEPIFGGLFRSGPRDLHNRGFLPDQFESLSPSERLRDAHRSMLSTLESENTALPGNDAQRRWLQDLQQGERYLMGSSLWRLSLAAWPVPMSLHRRLLSVRRALPFAGDSISERRVQRQLVAGRFPDLAAIPFDANAFNWYVLRRTPFTSLREFPLRIRRKIASLRGNEVRYYHRIEGLQHLHWDRLRAMAEPGREALGDLFDPAKLQAFLPGPGHPIPNLANPFSGSAPQRLLLGLMLRTQPDSVWTKSAEPSV